MLNKIENYVRIAKIKFNDSPKSKEYSYFCNDNSIDEGDVVYVEGNENPVFVYRIVEENVSTTLATANVIKKATYNENVKIFSIYREIFDVHCDSVVNSLGPEIGDSPKFLTNDLKAMLPAIRSDLLDNPYSIVLKTYVTDSFLPSFKKIINIVYPLKKMDYKKEQLKKAFSIAINEALDLSMESIAIPCVDLEAHGYTNKDVDSALTDTLFKYQYMDNIKIKIVVVHYSSSFGIESYAIEKTKPEKKNTSNKNCNMEMIEGSYPRRDFEFDSMDFVDKAPRISISSNKEEGPKFCLDKYEPFENLHNFNEIIKKYYKEKDEIKIDDFTSPIDFYRKYKKSLGYNIAKEIIQYVSDDKIKKAESRMKDLPKEDLYRLCFAMKLNFTRVIQFMEIFGYSFSPISYNDRDYYILEYIVNNNGFTKDSDDTLEYFYNRTPEKVSAIFCGEAETIS